MTERASILVTILFTDLVGSTELLVRAGDEDAQRVFRAHHDLLAETAAAHGGAEVKWLGDGLMVAFPSSADAVSCAIAMQQASRRPVSGERLRIRVGLNAGEAMRDAADWFGLPVVIARRLCDSAAAGQILCSEVVTGLLGGRAGFAFAELGKRELKGVPFPVTAFEVRYEEGRAGGLPSRLPFVGRQAELARLEWLVSEAAAGRGGLAVVNGEPGIGKTRLVEELCQQARGRGIEVLWGRCLEGGWAPPYAPFAEALEALAGSAPLEELRADLGSGDSALAQLVPMLRQRIPDLPEPVRIQPDEERFRLLDAVAQLLLARSERAPVLCCLDDLHWADASTVAMLRHLAHFAPGHRLLVLGTYRDAEVGRAHPLTEALAALRRDVEYERIHLVGLEAKAVGELLGAVGEEDVVGALATAIASETDGNPFFVKEVVRQLLESGRLHTAGVVTTTPLDERAIPEGVRDVIGRRLVRLSEVANQLLGIACGFEGPFRFDTVAAAAGLSDDEALDALDEALDAQLIEEAGTPGSYLFAHALIRHTLYGGLSSARRLRLHRRLAEALEVTFGGRPTPAEAAEVAVQYHRSRELPGAAPGVAPALAAAGWAEAAGGADQAVRYLRVALDLLAENDDRRPRLLGRLGVALGWALDLNAAVDTAAEAARALAATEGPAAAAGYLAEVTHTCAAAGFGMGPNVSQVWGLVEEGIGYTGGRRDLAWARLVALDHQRRDAEDPLDPGIPHDTPERREAARILGKAAIDPFGPSVWEGVFDSRAEARASHNVLVQAVWGGDYAGSLPLILAEAESAESRGRLARAARCFALAASCQTSLGNLADATATIERVDDANRRLTHPIYQISFAHELLARARDGGFVDLEATAGPLPASIDPGNRWLLGVYYGLCARNAARRGAEADALRLLGLSTPWLERAPAWTCGLSLLASDAAEVNWILGRAVHADVIERALREVVLPADFRYMMSDGRLALARLCALAGRIDEAFHWFAEARTALTEQSARTLLAICDHDEALMYLRRGIAGDAERARPLLEAARRQFETIGMTGWVGRAQSLQEQLR
jgi:class 3 adenylate cyclase